jgi:hypothetical protein
MAVVIVAPSIIFFIVVFWIIPSVVSAVFLPFKVFIILIFFIVFIVIVILHLVSWVRSFPLSPAPLYTSHLSIPRGPGTSSSWISAIVTILIAVVFIIIVLLLVRIFFILLIVVPYTDTSVPSFVQPCVCTPNPTRVPPNTCLW